MWVPVAVRRVANCYTPFTFTFTFRCSVVCLSMCRISSSLRESAIAKVGKLTWLNISLTLSCKLVEVFATTCAVLLQTSPRFRCTLALNPVFQSPPSPRYGGLQSCVSVFLLETTMSCAKTAEPIETTSGVWTRVGPRNHVVGVVTRNPQGKGQFWGTCSTPL